ncbi:MAG: hypothetical protein HQK91_12080 [Nitrospirae bacterium]|nr:hypothetical protein [Nitrospirota bacterium]
MNKQRVVSFSLKAVISLLCAIILISIYDVHSCVAVTETNQSNLPADSPFNPNNSCNLLPEFELERQYSLIEGQSDYSCISNAIYIEPIDKNSPHDVPSYIYYNAIGTKNEAKSLILNVKLNGYFSPDYADMKFLKTAHNLLKKIVISQAKIKQCNVPYKKLDSILKEIDHNTSWIKNGKWEILGMKVTLNILNLNLKYPDASLYEFEYHFIISQDNSRIKKTIELQPKTFVKDKLEIAPAHFEESPFNPKNSCGLMKGFNISHQYEFINGYSCNTDDINIETGHIIDESYLYRSTNYFYYFVKGEKYEATSLGLYLTVMDLDIADNTRKKYAKMACNLLRDVITMQANVKPCPIPDRELNTIFNEINNKIIDPTKEQKRKVWTIIGVRITLENKSSQRFDHDIQEISLKIDQDRSK